ncbi:NAD-dependent epimerase/dehydratase family protein [Nocardioides sp. W7]|uniref:NAD-dependent epimerase/dehydratase family protein n=1 Tax=Nocardioides sp. W7 TaxID=2931390 RepID=UPI001FD50327|nr:NAD-dependent epimerase/dehydratase family protein [Nocardioides sp. W7]
MIDENSSPVVVVTGANGLVGAQVCAALSERGARVRAVVRRSGTAPVLPGVVEYVGEFTDPDFAAGVTRDADAAVTTVHPMGSERGEQQRVGVEGTTTFARAAAEAGAARLVHVSTAAVYDRSPGVGDVDEAATLVGDDADDYAVTKRDADAALARVAGPTRVLLRPPAILGPGQSSIWNSLRPAGLRDDPSTRHVVPGQTFSWVHVTDLAALAADVAAGRVAPSDDADQGPVPGACTVVNVAAAPATARDYYGTLADALGIEIRWDDQPAWTGRIVADRARRWGWTPTVNLEAALGEVADGLR